MSESTTYHFQAEISQLLSLIINTFYSDKEIFLRELISNSSDALDKQRYQELHDGSTNNIEYSIKIIPERENKLLIIEDTGIGMTKEHLIQNLGTIAHSGTKAFMEAIANNKQDMNLIGQFGVGFYSGFLVADRVDVYSKHNQDTEHLWTSRADGSFNVSEVPEEQQTLQRGTRIVLHLKDDQNEYLDEKRLKDIINRHSQFINYPIYLMVEKERTLSHKQTTENIDEINPEDENEKDEPEDENEEDKEKTTIEKYSELEQLNKILPIWTRRKEDVQEDEYNQFYKMFSNDWEEPLAYRHFSIEGNITMKGVLFIPNRPPFDFFGGTEKKKRNIKLYVKRVFITDNCEEFVPDYLEFIKGVIDCEDLPLNISREMLQKSKIFTTIRKNFIKQALSLIEELIGDNQKYHKFYTNFSKNIKLGMYENQENQSKLSKFLRFYSSKSNDNLISLDQYIGNMVENQKYIYYLSGESHHELINSKKLEIFNHKNIEVLFMTEPIDEYVLQQFKNYQEKELIDITREGFELPETDNEKKQREIDLTSFEVFCKEIKSFLGDKVETVIISNKLVSIPACVSSSKFGWTANMERIMRSQALRDNSMMNYMSAKKNFEINPKHPIIKELHGKFSEDNGKFTEKNLNMISLLYNVALLNSGYQVENLQNFSDKLFNIIGLSMGIDEHLLPQIHQPIESNITENLDTQDTESLQIPDLDN